MAEKGKDEKLYRTLDHLRESKNRKQKKIEILQDGEVARFEVWNKRLTELEKENAELKAQNKIILEDNDTLNKWVDEIRKENAELKAKLNGALDICNIPEFRMNDLKNVIEEAIKDHCLFRQNEVINFTSKCVWEALNPDTEMCVPNAMFIKIEELLKDYIEKELAE